MGMIGLYGGSGFVFYLKVLRSFRSGCLLLDLGLLYMEEFIYDSV